MRLSAMYAALTYCCCSTDMLPAGAFTVEPYFGYVQVGFRLLLCCTLLLPVSC